MTINLNPIKNTHNEYANLKTKHVRSSPNLSLIQRINPALSPLPPPSSKTSVLITSHLKLTIFLRFTNIQHFRLSP